MALVASPLAVLTRGLPTELAALPPPHTALDPSVPHAPRRTPHLSPAQKRQALRNSLRYFAPALHATLAPEFLKELETDGHIYMRRFRPTEYEMRAYPIQSYPARTQVGAAIMLMIMNNLDARVAQYPHELITYGGNGSVFSNWAQYLLVMRYLAEMSDEHTLHLYSGHPLGLFPAPRAGPRVVLTNGLVIPNYSSRDDYDRLYALGVSQYGQMTAGSYCYIGPQGIVHGTTITVLGAARKYLATGALAGKVFVTAGLGGMSGAQAKAGVIAGAISVVAEINPAALHKRHAQGWVQEVSTSLDQLVERIRSARAEKRPLSIAYAGNVVDVWERLAALPEHLVELGSDQTSLHNPYGGGYYPVGLSFDEANALMTADPERFKAAVQASLRRHVAAINALTARGGFFFWDYGNSFLLEARRAGADVAAAAGSEREFRYPSYVEDIMGDVFSLGFGPFRWVCTSLLPADLAATDALAAQVIAEELRTAHFAPIQQQLEDNLRWIRHADEHHLVVGSQARILYADAPTRLRLAAAFNEAIARGAVRGPIVLSRDHHDVSGTDSPWRETANVGDGSKFTADMATHNFVGDATRGAHWVALHNGGGTGWGEAVNGGFGLLLDGSDEAARRAAQMLAWDVHNGVARRAWAGNENALHAIGDAMHASPHLRVTLPHAPPADLIASLVP